MLNRLPIIAVFAALALSPQARAQEAPAPPGYTPSTITVNARIVVLDVVVTDKKGNLIHREDLKQDDFKVFEDTVPQELRSFESPGKHRMPAYDRPIVTSAADLNKIGDAPVTIIVLDELNMTFQNASFSRQMAEKYLKTQPAVLKQPTVLMVASNVKFQQIHDYTQDRDALIDAVHKHMPEYPWAMMTSGSKGSGAVERMAQNLSALQQIAQASTGTTGRKNLIWIGNGFPGANFLNLPEDEAETISAAYKRCVDRLLAARITMFTINPTPAGTLTANDLLDDNSDEPNPDPLEAGKVSFASFATDTGGVAYRGRNDLDNVIGEGIERGREYYSMSYAPTNKSEVPGAYRGIKILMKDPNLRAVTRSGYYIDTAAEANPMLDTSMKPKQQKANLEMDLSSALLSTVAYNGLEVKAEKSGDGEYTIHVADKGITWSDPGPNGEQHQEATVAAGWYDAKGKLIGHVAKELLAPRGANNDGATFKLPVVLTGAPVRLRIVVRDAAGARMGTADITQF